MILSYGMGVESTAILLNWLENPSSRTYKVYQAQEGVDDPTFTLVGEGAMDLRDLVVLTAMTGDEFPDIKRLVERHILPRLKQHGVRYVQIARKSAQEKLIVLDDSRAPKRLFLEGAYKLSDELLQSATVPQMRPNNRRCSIHAKGWPLDAWIKGYVGANPFVQAVGFNSMELKRATRDQSYSAPGSRWGPGQRTTIYPLIWDWRWNREACLDYIRQVTGEVWVKSACSYCPFASEESVIPRFNQYPEHAAFGMFIERVALSLNPRQPIYGDESLLNVVQRAGDRQAFKQFGKMLDQTPWAIYHVRRIFGPKFPPRSVRVLASGKRKDMEASLASYGPVTADEYGIGRVWVSVKAEGNPTPPCLEELYVAAPHTMSDKEKKTFQNHWDRAVRGDWSFLSGVAATQELEEEQEYSMGALTRVGPVIQKTYLQDMDDAMHYDADDERADEHAWRYELRDILVPTPTPEPGLNP
jgi:hypothetical protein